MAFDNTSLKQSLAVQLRVIHALMMREIITRFGRNNLGVIWLVAEPMMFTLGVAALWVSAGLHHGSPIPIVALAVTGYSSVLMWRNSATRATVAVAQNKSLLYHRNVRLFDVFLTRIAIEIGGATGSFIVLSLVFIYIGWMPAPLDLFGVLVGWLMLAWFGLSLALLVGAGSTLSEVIERVWHPAAYLLFPLSGAAFMVEWLPPPMQRVVLLLPMVHGTEILREGYFGNIVKTHYSLEYMSVCCLVMTLAGLYLVRRASRHVEF